MTTDELWPRDHAHRYRLYARRGDLLEVLAAAPTMGGIGVAIGQLHEDAAGIGRRFMDDGVTGILDVRPGRPTGEWIVLPWSRPCTASIREAMPG